MRKNTLVITLALIALALGICPASAIFLDVHHDTQKKLDFTFDWHEVLFPFQGLYSGFSTIMIDWQSYGDFVQVDFYVESPLFHDPPLTFTQRADINLIYQPYPDNFIEIYHPEWVEWAGGKIAKDQMSARFKFFEKDYLPAPIPVPDGGSTMILLGMALSAVGFIRRC